MKIKGGRASERASAEEGRVKRFPRENNFMHVPGQKFGQAVEIEYQKFGRRSSGKEMSSTSCKITKL